MFRKFFDLVIEKRKIWIVLALLLPLFFSTQTVQADKPKPEAPTQEMVIVATPLDPRAVILRDYLAQYNSPLQDYASDFVAAADEYHVDWKLVPAISGVESTFGKQIPGGFNGWGWGVYGNQALFFNSWTDGIYTVTKGLSDNYISKGITDPYAINSTYAASPSWGSHVAYFVNDINQYAKKHPANTETVKVGLSYYSPAVNSAKAPSLSGSLNLVAFNR